MSQKMQIAFKWGLLGSLLTSLVMRKEKPVELIIDEKLTD